MSEGEAALRDDASRTGLSRSARRALYGVCALVFLWLAGFLWFTSMLDRHEITPPERAEGIVVLTGGADRIEDALRLLENRMGQRLFISGVNVHASLENLQKRWPGREGLFSCCIDLDYQARNTLGNAAESRRWVLDHGFPSILLVTASYHMPRALLEFRHAMPQTRIIPVHVVPDASKLNRWWQDRALARILMLEYVKYSLAVVRNTILGRFFWLD